MAQQLLAIFLQTPLVRLFVDAINRRRALAHQPRRHRLVRQQHAFLDQLVGHVVHGLLDSQNVSAFIQPDFGFGKIEVERTGLEPQSPDALGEFIRLMQHLFNRIGRGFALKNLQHLAVVETPLRMDDGGIKFRVQHPPVIRHEKFDAFGQAIHVWLERAQFVAQRLRQHRDDAVHEIGRVAAFARLDVQRRAGLHVMRHVRNVDPQPPLLR